MEIYFAEVDLEEYSNVDSEELFEYRGSYYWYKAVIDEDQICFYDTCGRHFPIGLDQVHEADTAMFAAKEIHNMELEREKIKQRTINKLEQLLEFWEKE